MTAFRTAAPRVVVREFATIGELADSLPGVDIEIVQTARGSDSGRMAIASLEGTVLHLLHTDIPHLTRGRTDRSAVSVVSTLRATAPILANGQPIGTGNLVFLRPGADQFSVNQGCSSVAYLTIPPWRLQATIAGLTGGDPPQFAENCLSLRPPPDALAALHRTVRSIVRSMHDEPAIFEEPAVRKRMDDTLVEAVARAWVAALDQAAGGRERPQLSRERMVRIAVQYLIDHLDSPVQLADLCAATGVSERSLRYAFQSLYNLSPTRFLKLLRLHHARRALLQTEPGRATVQEVALRCGFWETGRFAVEYQQLYEEHPSQSLRAPARRSGARELTGMPG